MLCCSVQCMTNKNNIDFFFLLVPWLVKNKFKIEWKTDLLCYWSATEFSSWFAVVQIHNRCHGNIFAILQEFCFYSLKKNPLVLLFVYFSNGKSSWLFHSQMFLQFSNEFVGGHGWNVDWRLELSDEADNIMYEEHSKLLIRLPKSCDLP